MDNGSRAKKGPLRKFHDAVKDARAVADTLHLDRVANAHGWTNQPWFIEFRNSKRLNPQTQKSGSDKQRRKTL